MNPLLHTTDSRDKHVIALAYQRENMPHENLYRKASFSYYPGRAGSEHLPIGWR